jgi:Fe-S-cluster containining protein
MAPYRTTDDALAAGEFSAWLDEMRSALRERTEMAVPCGDCTACCRSGHFVHVDADETDSLARIPRELLFAAPGGAPGDMILGYDEQGRCPMLVDERCSIYDHRPRACRTYDCRVFAATGFDLEGEAKPLVAERVARWRFQFHSDAARAAFDELHVSAARLAAEPGGRDRPATAIALRAITEAIGVTNRGTA